MSKNIRTALILSLFVMSATVASAAGEANVRVVHASPDAPPVDIVVNDALVPFEDVDFGMATDYTPVPASVYNVKVTPAGSPASSAVIEADLSLFYNTRYTVVALDEVANIRPIVLVDNNTAPPNRMSKLRFVHASPDAPPVDIKVVDGPFLFQDVDFTEVGNYVRIPQGIYSLEVRVAGTDTVVLELPGIDFANRATYTAFAIGFALSGEPSLDVLLTEDSLGFVGADAGGPSWINFLRRNR